MTGKPPGSLVRISYDGWATCEPGDFLRTMAGRLYLIHSVRIQQRGKHTGRQHLVCVVMEPGHKPEAGARVHRIQWYPRPKRRKV